MKNILLRHFVLLALVFSLSGCAGGQFFLKGNEKTLELDNDHGVVVFTSVFLKPKTVRLGTCIVKEVNQYKNYKELKLYSVPLTSKNYNVKTGECVISLMLPTGKYVFLSYFGMFVPSWIGQVQANMWAEAVFDVHPGTITYAGRLTFDNLEKNQPPSAVKWDDNFEEDVGKAKSIFPILSGKTVARAMFYD